MDLDVSIYKKFPVCHASVHDKVVTKTAVSCRVRVCVCVCRVCSCTLVGEYICENLTKGGSTVISIA